MINNLSKSFDSSAKVVVAVFRKSVFFAVETAPQVICIVSPRIIILKAREMEIEDTFEEWEGSDIEEIEGLKGEL